MKKPSIIFMGTPDFSVPTLKALHKAGFPVLLVVTQPDRPRGRGRKITPSPIKEAALSLGYAISQPPRIRESSFVAQLQELAPDFMVVVAFGQILPVAVLDIPKRGAVNVHASLLPKYRGPASIQWAMLRGEQHTGVTTILMDTGVDTGDILLSAQIPIKDIDTAHDLHIRLAHMGADLLVETLQKLWEGELFPVSQKHENASYAPMLKRQDGHIDWLKSSSQLEVFVRAMTPWPGAFCYHQERRLRLIRVQSMNQPSTGSPGMVQHGFPDELRIGTGQGILLVLEIQEDSGKRLAVKDFLRGHPMPPGTRLT
jgi:methionyl-tRNA formyltransferase